MEFEVEPCLEPKYCAVCWWWAWVKGHHRSLKNAVILLNGVPVCEEHIRPLLNDVYFPGHIICDFFDRWRKEQKEEWDKEIVECKATGQWNLRARLKVTMKEQSEEG